MEKTASYLRQINSEIKIAILTGYEDFDYARSFEIGRVQQFTEIRWIEVIVGLRRQIEQEIAPVQQAKTS
ncbi:hypothetical protein [Paenibacillus azoreducens]|uniref:Uncharacterized protein n=1 Tax=Paenibacillus azoreducens TaxID=116718 RepID=A0A920CWJ8_9BACL|nr:hypothetical protein [Paenibacillus azoreducens]GIO51448.1 hypothetical protein J34TS1_62130 [Paenibacillus azoreducens]